MLPGHFFHSCPFPRETIYLHKLRQEHAKTYYKGVCGLCEKSGHKRVQCAELTHDQRSEYEARMRAFQGINDVLQKASPFGEPAPDSDLEKSWRLIVSGI